MAGEDEIERGRTADEDAEAATATSPAESHAHDEFSIVDEAADSFLEVEAELGPVGPGGRVRGQAVDVAHIPAADVPENYPVPIRTDEALALHLALTENAEESAIVYFEWPEQGVGDRLSRMLTLSDVDPDRFADLHGKTLVLEREGNHYVAALPDEDPRGDERALYGVLGGLGFNIFIAAMLTFGLGGFISNSWFFVLWLVVNLVVLPVATYQDAWYVRTHTTWDGGPLFWGTLALIPGLNVVGVAAYLLTRGSAKPLA